jgi:RimJ/RimL family protein N-acetyltransferase
MSRTSLPTRLGELHSDLVTKGYVCAGCEAEAESVCRISGGDVVTRSGALVHIRPMRIDDADRLVAFHVGLSQETVYLRFFNIHTKLSPDEIHRFTHLNGTDRVSLVATVGSSPCGDSSEIVGVGAYDRSAEDPRTAEVAFVVADHLQGQGLGAVLLHRLALRAVDAGITCLYAQTFPENRPMQNVIRRSGYPYRCRFADGVAEFRLDISIT